MHILGWCLFPGTSVARVEVRVNGGAPRRARIGMERHDLFDLTDHPDAPIAGFEHKADLSGVPDDAHSVTIDAVAHAVDGRELHLEPVEFKIGAARQPFRDLDGRAAELRERSIRPLTHEHPPATEVRLLVFTHVLAHGGASLYLLELLRRLSREPDFHCEVVTLADGPLRDDLEAAGIPVHLTQAFPLTSVERYEGNISELLAWAAPGRFNAVLVNTLGCFAGGDVAARLGIPAVWAVHESFELSMFWHTAYPPDALDAYPQAQGEQAFASAAAVLFVADATRELFLANAAPERLLTLPYGVELDAVDAARRSLDRAQLRRRLGFDHDAQVVLCLGSIEARKSQAMLAMAFTQIAERHPRAHLVLVGETGDAYCADYRASLREYVARSGLADRVRVEPVTDDPYSWHRVADVLVCASDVESLPRVIAEAMAFGTPVLSTRVYGVPELIEDGVTGYLCGMRDSTDLAAGLDRVLSRSAEELAAVTDAASRYVRARHEPSAYADQVARLLRGLVADPDALPADLLAPADAVEGRRGAHSAR